MTTEGQSAGNGRAQPFLNSSFMIGSIQISSACFLPGFLAEIDSVCSFAKSVLHFAQISTSREHGACPVAFRLPVNGRSCCERPRLDWEDRAHNRWVLSRRTYIPQEVTLDQKWPLCSAGGNSGLGAETARVLAESGARVILTSRRVDAGEKVAATIRKKTSKAKPVASSC